MENCQKATEISLESGWNRHDVIQAYFHNSDLQTRWAIDCLCSHRFNGDESILDYGSGDGKITSMLTSFVPKGQVLGVDISQGMTLFSSRMFPPGQFSNLSFQSFRALDFSDFESSDLFDVVTSFCVFQLVPYPRPVLEKLYQLTKPQGKLVMTYPIGTNPAFSRAREETMKAKGLMKALPSPEAAFLRDPHQLRHVLSEIGYTVEKLNAIHVQYTYSSEIAIRTGLSALPLIASKPWQQNLFDHLSDLWC
jgi:SAM-dependent methyltransferase